MGIQNNTPQSSVKGNTPVIDFEKVESVNQVSVKQDPKPVIQTKPKPVEQVKPKENHGVIQTAPPKPKPLTEHEIYALKKDEQIAILNKLDVTEIPHYEKDRVALIVKLQ
jgi:hypothetical protein